MQISLKLIRLINHAKITVCIKFQLLVTFSSLFTGSSSLSVFPRSVLCRNYRAHQFQVFQRFYMAMGPSTNSPLSSTDKDGNNTKHTKMNLYRRYLLPRHRRRQKLRHERSVVGCLKPGLSDGWMEMICE